MPFNANVFIKYGPYEACGIVDHRISRLQGLQSLLSNDGHSVKLEQTQDWNTVDLYVNGKSVYKCDIRDLDYGSDGILDPLCREAAEAVKTAF